MKNGNGMDAGRLIEADAVPPHRLDNLRAMLSERRMTQSDLFRAMVPRLGTRYSGGVGWHVMGGVIRPRRVWIEAAAEALGVEPEAVVGPLPRMLEPIGAGEGM